MGELTRILAGGSPTHTSVGWSLCRRLTSSATTQVHILDLDLAHPNIYPILDLLESVKGLVLWNHT